ncbi:MAG: HAMP domain-containing sensor histidine kinase [Arcobacter sp.]|uniref:histidine kinase n=1 Tax=Arcobacter defluvii TaxID=873191 RepID=A0AAE7BGE4_9BACT|nr:MULTISPECIES: HAMP domain-containing sensor histidine kinase [Arcobacter]MDY3200977.1 HAMP domain-containing sensor histidine kinase [Arcobacter sp.]QKF77502.1 two-component system sensor histidine kinase [Arcobacter defluvii]RXI31657.1 histidine kinase [Arcobacter defluvii]
MNSKKRDFLISISIIFTFCLVIILYLNYFFISKFGLNQDNFIYIIVPLIILGLSIFLSFSISILKPLFKSDEKLELSIKETIHELNIPVSTIKMNTQLLEKTITDEKSLKRLERIKQASNNLLKLYENMEYNIKKEIDKIDKQEFFLDEIINTSIEKFDDIKNDTKIFVNIPNIKVKSDMNGFLKTIDNLISNAIKYNIKENPIVEISYKNSILSIYNSGEKIDTKNLFIVFDKYFQENPSHDGFGLGLAMVKEFCDKNKILINIETLESGNKFNLNLKNIII